MPYAGRILAPKPYLGHARAAASLLETFVMSCHSAGLLDATDMDAIAPEVKAPGYKPERSLPALHMSLGAGANVATALYEA